MVKDLGVEENKITKHVFGDPSHQTEVDKKPSTKGVKTKEKKKKSGKEEIEQPKKGYEKSKKEYFKGDKVQNENVIEEIKERKEYKFVVDGMLGKLCYHLRSLGLDTVHFENRGN